jgi:hypothetical protein
MDMEMKEIRLYVENEDVCQQIYKGIKNVLDMSHNPSFNEMTEQVAADAATQDIEVIVTNSRNSTGPNNSQSARRPLPQRPISPNRPQLPDPMSQSLTSPNPPPRRPVSPKLGTLKPNDTVSVSTPTLLPSGVTPPPRYPRKHDVPNQ